MCKAVSVFVRDGGEEYLHPCGQDGDLCFYHRKMLARHIRPTFPESLAYFDRWLERVEIGATTIHRLEG